MDIKLTYWSLFVFACIHHSIQFWDVWVGKASFLIYIGLIILFFVFAAYWLVHLVMCMIKGFKERERLKLVLFMTVLLTLSVLFPYGAIQKNWFESDVILLAERESTASCATSVILRKDHSFTKREVCFGVIELNGYYKISNDTIFFTGNSRNNVSSSLGFGNISRPDYDSTKQLLKLSPELDHVGEGVFLVIKDELKMKSN